MTKVYLQLPNMKIPLFYCAEKKRESYQVKNKSPVGNHIGRGGEMTGPDLSEARRTSPPGPAPPVFLIISSLLFQTLSAEYC